MLAGCKNDHGGFKKLILKELNRKDTSSWSSCCRERPSRTSDAHLGYIVGPRRISDKAFMHNDVKTWDSWDHYPNYSIIQENEAQNYSATTRRKKKWTGWRPENDEAKN